MVLIFLSTPSLQAQWFSIAPEGPRYWLKDPQGQRFFSAGLNCVLPRDGSVRQGYPGYDVTGTPGYSLEKWAARSADRLRAWGFNTVGSWSDDEACRAGLPFTVTLKICGPDNLIRVFDPDFPDFARSQIAALLNAWKNVRNLIGYFTDNELPWNNPVGWGGGGSRPLLFRFADLDSDAPGKKALVEFMRKIYGGNFPAFAKTWQSGAENFEALAQARSWTPVGDQASQDIEGWAGEVAGGYGRAVSKVLKELDPHHLNLGVRYAGNAPDAVLAALGPFCDVVSLNYYRRGGSVSYNHLARIHELSGRKPILISEFSWRAQQNRSGLRNSRGANVSVATQGERADRCRKYLEDLLSIPFVVGYHYFMMFDQSPGGRTFDGEDSNYGLVDLRDREYTELAGALREMNAKAFALHAGSQALPALSPGSSIRAWDPPRVQAPTAILGRNQAPVTLPFFWGDQGAGAESKTLSPALDPESWFAFGLQTGFGTGCGWALPLAPDPDEGMDLSGASLLSLRLKLSRGKAFRVFLEEAGVDHPGADAFEGDREADGESWSSPEYFGDGSWRHYRVPLSRLSVRDAYGNPAGKESLDAQALTWLSLYFPPNQGELEAWVGAITAEP